MNRLHTAIRYLPDVSPNPEMVDLTSTVGPKDNAVFLAAVATELQAAAQETHPGGLCFDATGLACIGLMGEYGLVGIGIRQAEAIIRVDHQASYWSHAFLFAGGLSPDPSVNRSPKKSGWIWESTLEPPIPFNHFIERNGVAARRVADYGNARFDLLQEHCIPNMAVLAIALTPAERDAIMHRADDPEVDQLRYDVGALLGTWYAYLTNQANQPNPLASGQAVYCSAYVQMAYDAVGLDLAPGAYETNTSPEHLWQTARYFTRSLRYRLGDGMLVDRPVRGWYCVRDHIGQVAPLGRGESLAPRRLSEMSGLAAASLGAG